MGTNPSEGYVSFNQPLRGVCVLQPTPPRGMCPSTLPRGMCPSTNPSEGYVSFNHPFRECILQPTLPREFGPISKLVQVDAKVHWRFPGQDFCPLSQPVRGFCVHQPTLPRGSGSDGGDPQGGGG